MDHCAFHLFSTMFHSILQQSSYQRSKKHTNKAFSMLNSKKNLKTKKHKALESRLLLNLSKPRLKLLKTQKEMTLLKPLKRHEFMKTWQLLMKKMLKAHQTLVKQKIPKLTGALQLLKLPGEQKCGKH